MYVRADVEAAIGLIAGGRIPVERVVTHSFALDEAAEAFRAAAGGIEGGPAVKIQLEPQR
jgi:threonine dehydrogenase-like Zn-dependent dehydrogenase